MRRGLAALALLVAPIPILAQRPVVVLHGSSEELKSVFFSGQPWLVQCVGAGVLANAATGSSPSESAHEVLQLALNSLPKYVNVGLLDCKKRLPSGKSTLERFRCRPSRQEPRHSSPSA
jgi:hypothetical protein